MTTENTNGPVAWILTNGEITQNEGEMLAHAAQGNEATPLYTDRRKPELAATTKAVDTAQAAAWMATSDEERMFGFVDPAVDLEAYDGWEIMPLYTRDEVERLLAAVTQ
jgi:hypothetical protein